MRTGIFFCSTNGNDKLNIDAIAKYSANLPEVETVQILKFKPLPDAKFISEQIISNNLGRIVIAGDIPGYFKPIFTKAMALTGGNTDEVRLASFQEHGARGENGLCHDGNTLFTCSHTRMKSCQSCNSHYWCRYRRDTVSPRNSKCRKTGLSC
jgi:heterodisulfide reductase subunit A-like polyferredoxin